MAEAPRPKQFMHRVLVVEDDYELAQLLCEVLTYENCTPEVAPNGMEALDRLRIENFDAVVCDLMMPRMGGEEFYEEVIKIYPYLADKFLFCSSQASSRGGLADFIYRTGNTLIEKPFEMDQFRTALQEMLSR